MAGVWSRLNAASFLAGLGEKDRDPPRLIGAVILGAIAFVATIAAITGMTLAAFMVGGAGLAGFGEAAHALADPSKNTPGISVARLGAALLLDACPLLAFTAAAVAVGREPLLRCITAAPRIRARLLCLGVLLAVLVISPGVVLERMFGGDGPPPILAVSPSWGGRLLYGAASLLLIPAAAAEELVFRGWLLRRVAAFQPPPAILVILTAVLFAAAHFDFNPDAFLTRALMGAGFAYMTLRLGGIEFSSGVHAANNMLIVLFLEPLNLQPEQPTLSALSLLEDICLLIGYFLITEAVVHIPGLRRWAGVRREELSPPDNRGDGE